MAATGATGATTATGATGATGAADLELVDLLERALAVAGPLVAGVRSEQWALPTPARRRSTEALGAAYDLRSPGLFGPAVDVPDEAPAVDRLAGFPGRRPGSAGQA